MKSHPPPGHLQAPGQALWSSVVSEFDVSDAAGVALLTVACEALDRCRQAQEVLASDGLTVTDQRGALKAHPAIAIERDAWGVMQRALRQLNLDAEPAAKPGRPSSRR